MGLLALVCILVLTWATPEESKPPHWIRNHSLLVDVGAPHLALPRRKLENFSADFDLASLYGRQCKALTHVFEQGSCPACFSFSLASLLGTRLCMTRIRQARSHAIGIEEMPCPYRIFDCAGGDCSVQKGLNAPQIMETMQRGVPRLGQTPSNFGWGCHGQSGSFKARMYRHVCGIDKIREELVLRGPVLLFIDLQEEKLEFSEWDNWESQLHLHRQNQTRVSIHSLMVIGWSSSTPIPHWIVKNSWGEDWGDKGRGRVPWKEGDCGLIFEPYVISV